MLATKIAAPNVAHASRCWRLMTFCKSFLQGLASTRVTISDRSAPKRPPSARPIHGEPGLRAVVKEQDVALSWRMLSAAPKQRTDISWEK